ncbi:hypothetical protein [Novosphingobium pentaromativorans]|uniref:hypothetical protein n=2 Tax=Novosphingobium pentaromativorans TaxID=205844 RepID=UPI00110FD934|nr:hypothetical protein [Novosphingobium pentaromativorans]
MGLKLQVPLNQLRMTGANPSRKIFEGSVQFLRMINTSNKSALIWVMDDREIDRLLQKLALENMPESIVPEFYDGIWERIGRLQQGRESRHKMMAAFCIVALGLGAGMATTGVPAAAQKHRYAIVEGADLSPAALLHISR